MNIVRLDGVEKYFRRRAGEQGTRGRANLQIDDHFFGGHALNLNVDPAWMESRPFPATYGFRSGHISALRQGPVQKIHVNDPADLVVQERSTEDEVRADVPGEGFEQPRNVERQELRGLQEKLEADTGALRYLFKRYGKAMETNLSPFHAWTMSKQASADPLPMGSAPAIANFFI